MQGGVRKRGNSWYYYFDIGIVDGKRKKIERKVGSSKVEAQKALRKALLEFETTGYLNEEKNISVSDYYDFWLKEYVELNCKHHTIQYYSSTIKNHIKPYFGYYKLNSLTPKSLQTFLNEKFKKGYSKNSLVNIKGLLNKSLSMAVHPYEYIKENPMQYVQLPKFQDPIKREEKLKIITIENYKTILKRFPKESIFYLPLQIAFNTGMRASEVCGLTWDCVDLSKGIIEVKKIILYKDHKWIFGTPKTKSSYRKILIGETLINILKEARKQQSDNRIKYGSFYSDSNFVCTRENGELVTTNSLKYLSRVINHELNIDFTFHSLRHTHASLLLEAGAKTKDIQNRLGHSLHSTTMDTYSHVTKKVKRDSANKFESILSK